MVTLRSLSALGDPMILRIVILILGQVITGATLLGMNLTEAMPLAARMGRKRRMRKANTKNMKQMKQMSEVDCPLQNLCILQFNNQSCVNQCYGLGMALEAQELALWLIGLQHALKAFAVLHRLDVRRSKDSCILLQWMFLGGNRKRHDVAAFGALRPKCQAN
ncbi:hypothetical protein IG631_21959 [Alternaria alternata]|nr:hypothetical protein IG631_21959 [Alternaria alternata]